MADLIEAWERAGAGDLSAFGDGWLLTAGPDRIVLDRARGLVARTPLEGHPADREHALAVATAPADQPGAWTIDRLVLDAHTVEIAAPDGPVVLDPHVDTWAVTLHDPDTLAALPQVLPATHDPLLRASAWLSVRNAVQHALLDPSAALDLLEAALPAEDTDDGVGQTLLWAVETWSRSRPTPLSPARGSTTSRRDVSPVPPRAAPCSSRRSSSRWPWPPTWRSCVTG